MSDNDRIDSNSKRISIFITANAIVWGAVMIGTSLVLKGSGYMDKLLPILGGGAGFSVVILSALLIRKK